MRADTDALGERIAEHVAHIDAAMHLLLTDLREFDRAGGWYHQGFQTCAHWLSWRVGWTLGTAREHVRVAEKLAELPQIDEALRTGEMSYSKVRAMTRVATKANEHMLLEEACHTTGHQLETICRKYALVQRHGKESNAKDDSERRYLKRRDQADGMVQIVAALHPEEAALVWAALERIVKEGYRRRSRETETDVPAETSSTGSSSADDPTEATDIPAGTPHTGSNGDHDASRRSEANEVRCDVPAGTPSTALDGDMTETTDIPQGPDVDDRGETTSRRDRKSVGKQRFDRADALLVMAEEIIRGSRPNRSPIELVLTVAAADLRARPTDETDPTRVIETTSPRSASTSTSTNTNCQRIAPGRSLLTPHHADPMSVGCFADGTAVSRAVVRRLACDAGLVGIIEDGGAPLSVGRKTRAIPAATKRALLRRDTCCRFPGCTNRMFVEGHHIEHWVDGGETKLPNLVALCRHHHRFVHEYGYVVELTGTEVRFFDPDGSAVPAVPQPARPARLGWETIRARNAELEIDADTPACGWDGGRIDLVSCIDELVRADERGERRDRVATTC